MTDFSFYWHDYETWGADPRRDRPSQFAGLRTDVDLNVIGDPLVLYCRPADDVLPHPEACLITGITPQTALAEGVVEADFFAAIHAELARAGTCGAGYNSIRFDDEVTRFGLYRNFFDPYAREWQNGNSRWDLIDTVRLTRALRPDGIQWPVREDGAPSFRLEQLTAENGIAHEGAHDALADVRATIEVARLIREHQPRLYDFAFGHRGKKEAGSLLNWRERTLVLHVSRRIAAELGCISPVVPLVAHPRNRNSIICFDLRHDPEPLLTLDADVLRERLYTPATELEDGEGRVGLKEILLNKCPVVVPVNTLTEQAIKEWRIDMAEAEQRRTRLIGDSTLAKKLAAIYNDSGFPPVADPDLSLYDGFVSDADKRRGEQIRHTPPEQLGALHPLFDDARLTELLFRYRARNWPELLSDAERRRWDEYRRERLKTGEGSGISLEEFRARLQALREGPLNERDTGILEALATWPAQIGISP